MVDEIIKEQMLKDLKLWCEEQRCNDDENLSLKETFLTDLKGSCFGENYNGEDVNDDLKKKYYHFLTVARDQFKTYYELYVMPDYMGETLALIIHDKDVVCRFQCKPWHFWYETEEELIGELYQVYLEIKEYDERTNPKLLT